MVEAADANADGMISYANSILIILGDQRPACLDDCDSEVTER